MEQTNLTLRFADTRLILSKTSPVKEASMNRGIPIIDKERCKGCGLCIANCPKDILVKTTELNDQGAYFTVCTDESLCIACGACAVMCPEAAIEINKLVEAV